MGGGDVHLGEFDVDADGIHAFVAEDGLEFKDVAAVAEEGEGEGVAEFVDAGMVDAGALGGFGDHFEEHVAVHGGVVVGGEEGVGGFGGGAGGEVFPDVTFAGVADEDDAVFAAFALADVEAGLVLVVVVEGEVAEFAGTDAGFDEGDDDGAVAGGGGADAGGEVAVAGAPGGGLAAGVEHGFDFDLGVGFDDGVGDVGAVDFAADGVGEV